jgi:hypothetical protein
VVYPLGIISDNLSSSHQPFRGSRHNWPMPEGRGFEPLSSRTDGEAAVAQWELKVWEVTAWRGGGWYDTNVCMHVTRLESVYQ